MRGLRENKCVHDDDDDDAAVWRLQRQSGRDKDSYNIFLDPKGFLVVVMPVFFALLHSTT